ncbi:hypothetical protein D3C84_893440 [compost metagenome]
MQAHLLQLAPALEAGHAALDQEQADAVTALGVGTCCNHHHVSENAVGDISLRTVEQPVVTTVLGSSTNTGQVTSGIGLGHCNGEDALATDRRRQEAHLLLGVGELVEVRTHQHGMGALEERDVAVAHILLHQDLLIAQVAQAQTTKLLLGPHQQVALGAGF